MRRTHRMGIGVLAVMLFASGCYGPFYLTRKVHAWNGSLGDKWINEIGFLIMLWIPVYGVANLADAIIFNSIEFWTGNNPAANVEGPQTRKIVRGDSEAVLTRNGDELTIEQFHKGQPGATLHVVKQDGATIASDAQGNLLFTARTMPDGSLVIADANGQVISSYSADRVEQFAQSIPQ